MNDLTVFENPEFGAIRTVELDGEPWLVGKDVAQALGYSDTKSALADHVDDEDKQIIQRGQIATLDIPNRGMTIINESGLYSLVLSSKLPTARKFRRWVTSEVIPSIRRSGGYIAGQKELSPEELMARALKVANDVLAAREARISELTVQNTIMAPKADYFDELVDRNLLTSFRDTAKQLGVSQNAFIGFLKDRKYIYRDQKGKLMPYAEKNNGLFEVKECFNNKTEWSGVQTMVTPKGRETFRLLLEGCKKEI